MTETLLAAMRARLRESRLALDAAVKAERRTRAAFESRRVTLDTYAAAVRETAEAACDVASLALAIAAVERIEAP